MIYKPHIHHQPCLVDFAVYTSHGATETIIIVMIDPSVDNLLSRNGDVKASSVDNSSVNKRSDNWSRLIGMKKSFSKIWNG